MRAWADHLAYDDQAHVAHYSGNVRAQKQDLRITAAEMVATGTDTPDKSVSVSEITAKGNVGLTRGISRGSGDEAIYNGTTQRVVLTGSRAEVTDGDGTTTQGPRIVVNVAGDKMAVVEGGGGQKPVTTHKVKK